MYFSNLYTQYFWEMKMFENLKEMAQFDYKDSYEITEKIEGELIQEEENSHKFNLLQRLPIR